MSPLIPLALIGWIPLALALFAKLPAHRAAIAGFALAWMFLPEYSFDIGGLPDYGKTSALGIGILGGSILFHSSAWKSFRLRSVDLPVLAYIAVTVPTAVTNGLGFYEGLSYGLERFLYYGVPWFIGRVHFRSAEELRELVLGIFLAGLLYAPFLLFEMVMSPQLHRIFYGFHPHDFNQSQRGGGYRPVVFMKHGLATAMWTAAGTLAGFALLASFALLRSSWLKDRFPTLGKLLPPAVLGIFAFLLMSRSAGALFLCLGGIAILFLPRRLYFLALVGLLILPPTYMVTRATGVWDGQNLVRTVSQLAGSERAASLDYRLYNENLLVDKAMERPWFGWGRFQRSFVLNEKGEAISVPDGMWILALGRDGVIGLIAVTALYLLPVVYFLRAVPVRLRSDPMILPLSFFPIFLLISMADNLLNDMSSPMTLLTAGAITGWILQGAVRAETPEAAPAFCAPSSDATAPRAL